MEFISKRSAGPRAHHAKEENQSEVLDQRRPNREEPVDFVNGLVSLAVRSQGTSVDFRHNAARDKPATDAVPFFSRLSAQVSWRIRSAGRNLRLILVDRPVPRFPI
jgi:hypothetical protein